MKSKTQASGKVQTKAQDVELVLSDAVGMAEEAVGKALEYCAEKMALESKQAAVDCLRQGDRSACGYFYYSLAGQAAEWLGAWDESIKAVYVYDCDATPEDQSFSSATQPDLLHLIVWARRKTSALNAILEALDRALVQCCSEMPHMRERRHVLDAQVIDDDGVQNNIGCGVLLSSIYTRPIRIWER